MEPATAPQFVVPEGWSFVWEDGPGIERRVGDWVLAISDETSDGNGWGWWVCPVGSSISVRKGRRGSLEAAVFASVDALLGLL